MKAARRLQSAPKVDIRIDPETLIVDYKGQPIKDGDEQPLTFGAIVMAFLNNYDVDKMPANKKRSHFMLSMKLAQSGPQSFSIDEVGMIHKAVDAHATPLVLGRVRELTEGLGEELEESQVE